MKKILLILTGGTIGSRIDADGTISPNGKPLILEYCRKPVEKLAEFDVSEPFCTLSENMTLSDRETLIKEIAGADVSKYDGIIITHGSDTLTYTAALCGMALRHIDIPIVFIASDLVLSDPCSNGPDNFESAVTLICESSVKRGIYICYRDLRGENSVYLATRLCEADPFLDRFHGFDGIRFGKTEDGSFIYEEDRFNPSLDSVNTPKTPLLPLDFNLKDDIALLRSCPAFDYSRFDISGLNAIINYGYHSATVDERSFLEFAKRCNDNNVFVYLASFKDPNSPIYESLEKILELPNVKRLYNISPESAYAKVSLAYSVDKSLLDENIYYETIK